MRDRSKSYPAPAPPKGVLAVKLYPAPAGLSVSYMTPDPKDGKKHPAIVWINGGDCNSIDSGCWEDSIPAFDQSASSYRKSGIAMMFPALRGNNDNPGKKEGFFGEVEDRLSTRTASTSAATVPAGPSYCSLPNTRTAFGPYSPSDR